MYPSDFLNFTARSLKDDPQEANLRSSISRSYYSIYHQIKQALEKEGVSLGDDHKVLPLCFFNSGFTHDVVAIGSSIQTLHADRKKADYHLNKIVNKNHANSSFKMANKVVNNFFNLYNGEFKTAIISNARTVTKNAPKHLK